MKRPENIINPKDYDKPQSFEKDWDAEIYYSYIEAQKYIDYLESEVKKFRLGAVVGQSEQLVCDRINNPENNRCIKCGAKAGHPCYL